MARVVLKNFSRHYGTVHAVENLNIEIADREFAVLVGPSGCGKTTTLRAIAGLESVTEGEIWIGDRLVNNVYPKDRDIAMVFQSYALYPHMTVYENMAFGLRLRKISAGEIKERVGEAAAILGIENLLERKPRQLSGGQRQRVAVGRAIVRRPKVFLFDEPLSNLDAKLRVAMRAEINRLHKRLEATVIYVTHDQVEAMTMATKMFVMKDGVLQQEGQPMTIYKKPRRAFVGGFIGSPAMNFFSAIPEKRDGVYRVSLENEIFSLKSTGSLETRTILLGLRPEDFSVTPCEGPGIGIDLIPEVIEFLGDESYIHFICAGHNAIARLRSDIPARIGEPIRLYVPGDRIHVFDEKSGERLEVEPVAEGGASSLRP